MESVCGEGESAGPEVICFQREREGIVREMFPEVIMPDLGFEGQRGF